MLRGAMPRYERRQPTVCRHTPAHRPAPLPSTKFAFALASLPSVAGDTSTRGSNTVPVGAATFRAPVCPAHNRPRPALWQRHPQETLARPPRPLPPAILHTFASLSTGSRTFHSLSKVLFIFPSRYLFAIGLLPLFSLGWRIPPAHIWTAFPNNPTLRRVDTAVPRPRAPTGLSPSAMRRSRRLWPARARHASPLLTTTIRAAQWCAAGFQIRAVPGSLAVTEGILVSFCSSAY